MTDDADLLRYDDDDDDDERSRRADPADDSYVSCLAVTKTVATYPTAAGNYVAFDFKGLLGAEAEGGPGTPTTLPNGDRPQQYAYIPAGATVPGSGTEVLVVRVKHRWVLDV